VSLAADQKNHPPERCTSTVQRTGLPLVGSPLVRRISVVGTSGSGKSRLARDSLDAGDEQVDPEPVVELRVVGTER